MTQCVIDDEVWGPGGPEKPTHLRVSNTARHLLLVFIMSVMEAFDSVQGHVKFCVFGKHEIHGIRVLTETRA